MTGGIAIILGRVGANFGAGMTGGMAFVYDESRTFASRANPESIIWQRLASEHWEGVAADARRGTCQPDGQRLGAQASSTTGTGCATISGRSAPRK